MIVSVNWLKKFTTITSDINELAELIGTRLVEIESITSLGEKYKDVVVARVIECEPIEGSDHLNVAIIDDGGVIEAVERDEHGYVQVVCGAPNVRKGLLVAWLPPQSIVPETFGQADPFILGTKKLRGVKSNGMLASARELDLFDDHSGILEIDKEASAGASFASLYELDDYLLDIENKSLTHRPDAFGIIGFAREVAGIQGISFETPEWLRILQPTINNDNSLEPPAIIIEDSTLSDRFQAILLHNINDSASSPIQMQTYLARSGVRPINAAVDVSNYLMLLTGQPSHTYDYDKLKKVAGDDFTVRVRLARENETLVLLDGKKVQLDTTDIVIAAGETAVGLAGIMGGLSTAVDESTTSVLLEVATFDLYHMRSSQMRHGIFSEAVTRFTKGISAPLSAPVLAEAVRMLTLHTDAMVASNIVEAYPGNHEPITVSITQQQMNDILGTSYSLRDMDNVLSYVEFETHQDSDESLTVIVPYWRRDIHIPEDIAEEIGRLYGFDSIHPTLPQRSFSAVKPSDFDVFRTKLRSQLVRAGANEVVTYSFVHGDILQKVGQSKDNAYKIINSLSPDLQFYRQSITPSLLSNVFQNRKMGYDSFALFELNKVHQKQFGLTNEQVPVERDSIAYIVSRQQNKSLTSASYYDAKRTLEFLMNSIGVDVDYEQLASEDIARIAPFEPLRSASIVERKSRRIIGVIGEYKKMVQKSFKLSEQTAGFELDTRMLFDVHHPNGNMYYPLSRYPGTERDICFQVPRSTQYQDIIIPTQTALQDVDVITHIEPVDIYQSTDSTNSDTKNITIRIKFVSYHKTLTGEDVSPIVEGVIKNVIKATGGKVL